MLLSEKAAIITGGAKGIGRGIAIRFAREGCSVAIADVALAEGEKTVELIKKEGGTGILVQCDVTNSQQVHSMVKQVIGQLGKVDILVNNAGGVFGPEGCVEDISEEMWDRILDLNLKSQFLCCKTVVPHMKARRFGKIINISSMGVISPPVPVIHYCCAKAGVLGLTSNLALELASYNINVNAILPGPIRTSFHDPVLKGIKDKDKNAFFDAIAQKEVPLRRVGTPEDISGVALFLASELSSFLTGEFIYAAGGQPLRVWSP